MRTGAPRGAGSPPPPRSAIGLTRGSAHLTKAKSWRKVADHFPIQPGCENLGAGKLKHVYAYLYMEPGTSQWMEAGPYIKKDLIEMKEASLARPGDHADGNAEAGKRSQRKSKKTPEFATAMQELAGNQRRLISLENAYASSDDEEEDGRAAPAVYEGEDEEEDEDEDDEEEDEGYDEEKFGMFWQSENGHVQDGVSAVPTFHPTESEFEDPHRYILSLREAGLEYGAVRIVPPASWSELRPPFGSDISPFNFKFNTRWQSLHKVQHPEVRPYARAGTVRWPRARLRLTARRRRPLAQPRGAAESRQLHGRRGVGARAPVLLPHRRHRRPHEHARAVLQLRD